AMNPSSATMEIDSPDSAKQAIREAQAIIRNAAKALREADPEDPLPYRLSRIAEWIWIMNISSSTDWKHNVGNVESELLNRLKELAGNEEWDALLAEAEGRLPEALLWLDLQRYVDKAMEGLGSSYRRAREAVRGELAALVGNNPSLLDRSFFNGIPYADDATKLWINDEVLSAGPSQMESKAPEPKEAGADSLDQVTAKAERMAAKGNFKETVAMFQEGIKGITTQRERFRWKLKMAQICLEAGGNRFALPILDGLDEEMPRFTLEEWEPDLCAEVIRSRLLCDKEYLDKPKKAPPESLERARKLLSRLYRLDAVSAMSFDGEE
ncbi:type VI secretion system domain-containing protein, partial [Thermodesulfobacteriota bacterium]